jgi:hypothetical protein
VTASLQGSGALAGEPAPGEFALTYYAPVPDTLAGEPRAYAVYCPGSGGPGSCGQEGDR